MISSSTTDTEIDSHKLRSALDMIVADLAVPFLEKRARTKSNKKTPLEELNSVINELTNREKELQAAVGIAQMLLERNDEIIDTKKKLFVKKQQHKLSIKHLEREIESLKEQLISSEEKYQQVNDLLANHEEENIKTQIENKRLLYELALKTENKRKDSGGDHELELFEAKSKFNEQYNYLTSKIHLEVKNDDEKKIKLLEDSLKKQEKAKSELIENLARLEKEQIRITTKLKSYEIELLESQENFSALEEKCKELTISNLRLRAKNEKLAEDIKFLQAPANPLTKKPKISRRFSLKSELDSISELKSELNSLHTYALSESHSENSLSGALTESIAHIVGKRAKEPSRRKDPSLEYFTLAVKLNSPYMDAICVIPPQALYEKALKEDIPFHKWHLWVESQLASAYIQVVYNTDSKSTQNA